MATRKFSAFTNGSTNQAPADELVGLDQSQPSASRNTRWTLNNLFAYAFSRNVTDQALRWTTQGSAPAVSAAGQASLYFNGTNMLLSTNGDAYATIIRGTTASSGRVPFFNSSSVLATSANLVWDDSNNELELGAGAVQGAARFNGTNGNGWFISAMAPATNRTFYLPDSTTPSTGNLFFVGTFGATVQMDWTTGLFWNNTSRSLTGTRAVNDAGGLGFANTSAGTAAQTVLDLTASTAAARLGVTSAGFTTSNLLLANQVALTLATGGVEMLFQIADASTRFRFGINNVEIARWNATGLSLTASGATAANPSTLLDIQTGVAGASGIRTRNLTSASTPTAETTYVAVDASGNFVLGAPGAGGTPGGSSTQIQYNNAGAFGGVSGATTNGTAITFTAANLIATSPRFVTGINDTNGNELFLLTATGSAVNEFTVANAATGNNPTLSATGNDTNIGITLTPKGTGVLRVSSGITSGSGAVAIVNATGNLQVQGFASASLSNPAGTKLATTTGAYVAEDLIKVDANGDFVDAAIAVTDVALLSGTGPQIFTGNNQFNAAPTVLINDAATNTVTDMLTLSHTSTGTVAASFGAAIYTRLETDSGTLRDAGKLRWIWTTAADATRTSSATIQTVASGGGLTTAATFTNSSSTFPGTVTVSGASVSIGAAGATAGNLVLQNATNSNATTISSGAAASALNYIMPVVDPTAGQVLSASAPSGANVTLSWISPSGTPGGSNTQLQYNNVGGFGGISGATSDGTNVTYGSGNLRATSPRITTSILDTNGNELAILTATGSAVNEFTYANAASGTSPTITMSGNDSNVGLNLTMKGTGTLALTGRTFTQTATGANVSYTLTASSNSFTPTISLVQTGAVQWDVQSTVTNGFFSIGVNGGEEGLSINRLGTAIDSVTFPNGNVGIGTATFGTSADRTLAILLGTAPTTQPTDTAQIFVSDLAAGQAALRFLSESGSRITLGSDQLIMATGTTDDTFLGRAAAASWRLGAADAASPVAQNLQVQSVVAGTSNTAGMNWTFKGSQGTGTGLGGSIIFQVANLAGTGSTVNALGTAFTIAPPNTGTTAVVNGVTLTGAIASGSPTLSATGSDTNISLTLTPKGTGRTIGTGVIDATTGFRVNNAATSGQFLRGNGTNFISAAFALSDLPAGSASSHGIVIGVAAAGGAFGEIQLTGNTMIVSGSTLASTSRAAYKASSETVTSSTTLQNDDELSVTLDDSTAYFVDVYIPVSNAGATAGFKLAFGGTATFINFNLQVLAVNPADGLVLSAANIPATGDGSAVAMAMGTAVTMVRVSGSVDVNAGGTFVLRWAQNVSSGSGTTVQVGGAISCVAVAIP